MTIAKVSVVIPVYNAESFLERCLKSVTDQTYRNLQIILINDGSSDSSPDICMNFKKADTRIEIIDQKNQGLSAARNAGLACATGKYILFVDSDDYIAENMVELMVKACEEKKVSMCVCGYYYTYPTGKVFNSRIYNEGDVLTQEQCLISMITDDRIGSYAWNKLYKTELFQNIKYPTGKNYEDICTTYRLIQKCERIAVVGQGLYFYVQHEKSITHNKTEKNIADLISAIEQRKKDVKFLNKDMQKLAEKEYLKSLIIIVTHIFANDLKGFDEFLFNSRKNLYKNSGMLDLKYRTMAGLFCSSPMIYREIVNLTVIMKSVLMRIGRGYIGQTANQCYCTYL